LPQISVRDSVRGSVRVTVNVRVRVRVSARGVESCNTLIMHLKSLHGLLQSITELANLDFRRSQEALLV